MRLPSTYDKHPVVSVSSSSQDCAAGWPGVLERLRSSQARVLCVECYPGVFVEEIERTIAGALRPSHVFRASECMKLPEEVKAMLAPYLGDDPVFGRMNGVEIIDFLDPGKLATARERVSQSRDTIPIIGTGASLLVPRADVLVHADMARWEIQTRQRNNEIANLGATNHTERPALKYKRAFFVDWRAADRLKKRLLPKIDFLLDTIDRRNPKLISGDLFRRSLETVVRRPFRVVPFFDPGPWGGEWMRRHFELSKGPPNYAWCFDCVPEENSLLLGFGDVDVEIPALDLVFSASTRAAWRGRARTLRHGVSHTVRHARHHGGRQFVFAGPSSH